MRADGPLVIALNLFAFGCGGIAAIEPTSPGPDGGSAQTTSTATDGTTATGGSTTSTSTYTGFVTVIGTGTDTVTASLVSTNTTSCVISPSNYDQSCAIDGDCVLVASGNFCVAGCLCANSVIAYAAFAQYETDFRATPLVSGAFGSPACNCPAVPAPCCRQGQCTTDCAAAAADTLPACANAGGACVYSPLSELGPPCQVVYGVPSTGCAYADEACCVSIGLPQ